MNPIRIPALLLSLLTVWTSTNSFIGPDPSDLDARLDRLVERLDQERGRMHVPGLAIAVIKDDEVVLARGLGYADLENETPVTVDTVFAAGSTTKAFTAALVGMLVDEGKMDWNDPVTDFLPFFDLALETKRKHAEATMRDLLSHRTGYTRMSALWMGTDVTREEVLQTAAKAEPWKGYRKEFLYNNVMFLAAGQAAAAAAESDWDTMMRERLLDPLGMETANTTVAEAKANGNLALGYLWDEGTETYEHKEMLDLSTIGPAGALNGDIEDMAQWVRFQLGRGEIDGKRLLSEENLVECWDGNTPIAPQMEYGLGWFVREYDGQVMIEHGGNIGGFAAQIGFLPEENLGFVLLMNVAFTELQQGSLSIVFDTLLGEETKAVAASATDIDFADFVGSYRTSMAQFGGEDFEVVIKDGQLAVDVPGQTTYSLVPPDDEGKWYFALTNTIAVGFDRDDAGEVTQLNLFQNGLKMEMPRRGVAIPIEIDLEDARRYCGVYRDDALGDDITVVIEDSRLALDVPNQMVFQLHAPNDEGKWVFRAIDLLAVIFDEQDDGTVTGFTFFERGTERYCPRVGDGEPTEALPTVDEILALQKSDKRAERWVDGRTSRSTGTVRAAQSGLEGTITMTIRGADSHLSHIDFGRFGFVKVGLTAETAWIETPVQDTDVLTGERFAQARLEHPAALWGDWRATFDEMTVDGLSERDGRKTVQMTLQAGDLPPYEAEVDAETGDLVWTRTINIQSPGVRFPIETTFAEFREVDGIRIPSLITTTNDHSGRTIIHVDSIEDDVEVDDALFELPADVR